MSVLQIAENEQTSEFYPTPQSLVEKMLQGIDWDYIHTVLEPSAGKGDILRVLATKETGRYNSKCFDVDCIELDPNLRQILKYNFSDDRITELRKKEDELKPTTVWNNVTRGYETNPSPNPDEFKRIEEELNCFFRNGIHIVHDNFLTYNPYKQYDLIIMNPPFSNGDKHLLKALKMQEKGGNIICLLNAETLKNPYTETRRELLNQLNKHSAMIEYIDDAFISAERRTDVEIALIKVAIERVQEESDIYNRFKEAEQIDDIYEDVTDIEVTDYIKAAVNQFNVEVKAGLELIRQYRAMMPYMQNSFDEDSFSKKPILRLTNSYDRSYYDCVSVNDYLKDVRYKYWRALLSNPKFTGKLTSKLQTEYSNSVDKLKDYDFTAFNIYTLSAEMNSQIKRGVEEEIIAMFDRLTAEHSWYPECQKNKHYYNGWKTNKAHKIDKKVIIPCYGVFDSYDGKPRTYEARKVLEDIERILNFLDGGMTREVDSWDLIKSYFETGVTKNITQKFYKVTFYKKGTVHITFTCPELIERFNIYAAQHKAWLPPSYGKKAYKDMSTEEKTVVDSFQGEQTYNKIMEKSNYYFAPVTSNRMLMLEG
jgi:hypothetical protein